MSYNSKRMISCMVASIILFVAYIIYALGSRSPQADDLRGWAIAILIFIGIGIAAVIVIMILFHIVFSAAVAIKEGESEVERIVASHTFEDERDKLIELKASKIGYVFAGIGFLAALTALAFTAPPVIALHILFGSFAFGSFIEGGVSIYLYERGI